MRKVHLVGMLSILMCNIVFGTASARMSVTEGTWYGYLYKDDFHGFVFRSDGSVHTDKEKGLSRQSGTYKIENNQILIQLTHEEYTEGRPFSPSREPLRITGNFQGNSIHAVLTEINGNERKIELTKGPICKGTTTICGGGFFCNHQNSDAFYWRQARRGQAPQDAMSLSEFDDFFDFFRCAVQHNQYDLYFSKIKFPFKKTLLFEKRENEVLVPKSIFNSKVINPDGAKRGRDVIYIITDKKSDRVVAYRRTYENVMEWEFERKGTMWFMVGSTHGGEPTKHDSWFALRHCRGKNLNGFTSTENSEREEFDKFIKRFYCAIKSRDSDKFTKRIKFPLSYKYRTENGFETGELKKIDFEISRPVNIHVVDGGEVPLSYYSRGDDGWADIGSHSAGSAYSWKFRRIGSRWYLVEVENRSH